MSVPDSPNDLAETADSEARRSTACLASGLLLAAGLFSIDAHHPVGATGSTPYVIIVLAGLLSRSSRQIFGFAVLASALSGAGALVTSPTSQGVDPEMAALNRILVLLSTWCLVLVARRLMLVENALRARLVSLATKDELTGVANRRAVLGVLSTTLEERRRRPQAVSVLLLDVDHFKRVNDSWGHHVGDLVLRRVSRLIAACLRAEDLLGRIGGEEFLVVLPETTAEGARVVAERIRARVAIDAGPPRVTLSIGVAEAPQRGADAPTLVRLADQALLQAKRSGRNRVQHAQRFVVESL